MTKPNQHMQITVETRKGFYDACSIQGFNLKSLLGRVIPKLDEMPEEVDGEKLIDWTRITITIERKRT